MFYHKTKGQSKRRCGGQVFIDVSDLFTISSSINIVRKSLKVTSLDVNRKEGKLDGALVPIFICSECKKQVEIEEIMGECSACFDSFDLTEIHHVSGFGGFYCDKDLERIDEDERGEVAILSRVFKTMRVNKAT